MPDDLGLSPAVSVVQLRTCTRASAQLGNLQPEANLQSHEECRCCPSRYSHLYSVQAKSSQTSEVKAINCERAEPGI
ncbi:hypothetical protein V6N11_018265 [Hibiscus sabdariffa]|uniref:Uncharacterized protein n=1 Tax=Hibiscus sabdariffa TaxID=183260 RepID=A0ABR2T7D6_9ROSI